MDPAFKTSIEQRLIESGEKERLKVCFYFIKLLVLHLVTSVTVFYLDLKLKIVGSKPFIENRIRKFVYSMTHL